MNRGTSFPRFLSFPRKRESRFFAALLIALTLTACSSDTPQYSALPAGTTVLAFGDSVTHGTGAGPGEDYPSRLAEVTGWQVVNSGIPGDTAREAKSRLAALLQRHQPALVIIELGGNDFLRKQPASTVKGDLEDIIRQSQEFGAITALVSVPRVSLLRAGIGALKDADIYVELAEESGVILLPGILADVLSEEHLRADPVHPNAAGYRLLNDGVVQGLRNAGLLY